MSNPKLTELSNPISTGGGGVHFENRVQTAFTILMLVKGFSPCLERWPISKIKFQAKYTGVHTDDLIVTATRPNSDDVARLLGQIKRSIQITDGSTVFGDVIKAAWEDFTADHFTEDSDILALITGPLAQTDTDGVRGVLQHAAYAEDAEDFRKRIKLRNFASDNQRKKLAAFEHHLKGANNGSELTEEQLWQFLRHYRLLIYDLDIEGVTHSLLHTVIEQASDQDSDSVWSKVMRHVSTLSENAGAILADNVPRDIAELFSRPRERQMPPNLWTPPTSAPRSLSFVEHADVALYAALVGAWRDDSEADNAILSTISGSDDTTWKPILRSVLLKPKSPINLQAGVWRMDSREKIIQEQGGRLFDDGLERFETVVIKVLRELDPQFELAPENRYAATIHSKVLTHSRELRRGLAESLAIIGCNPKLLPNCTPDKAETFSRYAVKEILDGASWILWGSLDPILPHLAEAAPTMFLEAVEAAVRKEPCPFLEVFAQEGKGFTGRVHSTGLLWALETLAWDKELLVRVAVVLGKLAAIDPGGRSRNSPLDSLTRILLPWNPQTTATAEKRIVAVESVDREQPETGWKLLISLLPNVTSFTHDTRKPTWRTTVTSDWTAKVSNVDYRKQVAKYSGMVADRAIDDNAKFLFVLGKLGNLSETAVATILDHLSAPDAQQLESGVRVDVWNELQTLVSRHRKYADSDWSFDEDVLQRIEVAANNLAPTNAIDRYRRLFQRDEPDLFEGDGTWEEKTEKLQQRRISAIREILKEEGFAGISRFVELVEMPRRVGWLVAEFVEAELESHVLPGLLTSDSENQREFANGFVDSQFGKNDWAWAKAIDMSRWQTDQVARLLTWLPFGQAAWNLLSELGKDIETAYWQTVSVNRYCSVEDNVAFAIDNLLRNNRPKEALCCIYASLQDDQPLDCERAVKALLALASSEEHFRRLDNRSITDIIAALQKNAETDASSLRKIEFSFLDLLDGHRGAVPIALEKSLASDPDFFCDAIKLIYRSKNEPKPKEPSSTIEQLRAERIYTLLQQWHRVPGLQDDGTFSPSCFWDWLNYVKDHCRESGHIEVAMSSFGEVLTHAPPDPDGLWIHRTIAKALSGDDASDMRHGFQLAIHNSRGAHWIGTTGEEEFALAKSYLAKAEDVENAGYFRFAVELRDLAESYDQEGESVKKRYGREDDD